MQSSFPTLPLKPKINDAQRAIFALVLASLAACAGPGQPPNAGNTIVGIGVTVAGDAAIAAGVQRLNTAYQQGKINVTQYNAMYGMAVKAENDINALGAAIAANQTVTQAQVDTAVAEFIVPLVQLIPTAIPAPVTQLPASATVPATKP